MLTNKLHNYGDKMSINDLNDHALFVIQGQVDFNQFIDSETNLFKIGNVKKGKKYFKVFFAQCHKCDRKQIEDMAQLVKITH